MYKPKDHLELMVHNATAAGLSYGQYIARYHPVNFAGPRFYHEPSPPPKKKKRFKAPVIATNPETGEVRHYSSMTATQEDGFTIYGVEAVLDGRQKMHKGWCFCRDE